MPSIDYMKVLDIAAHTLESSSHIKIEALDINMFKAILTKEDNSLIEIFTIVNEFDLELSFSKSILDKKEFIKWLSDFEFQLEQNFFTNISIEHSQSAREYKIMILF